MGHPPSMNDQQLANACELRDQGKLREAVGEFLRIAQDAENPIDKADVLLYAVVSLKALGEYNAAMNQLGVAKKLILAHEIPSLIATHDYRIALLEVRLDFEVADIHRFTGRNEEALAGFEAILKKYAQRLSEPDFREARESIQACRAFILADLGRWKEAMPILVEGQVYTEYKEGIAFYLGHCYLGAGDFARAKDKLVEALRLGLPHNLEYRAHYELGIAYYELRDYVAAKRELENCANTADKSYLSDGAIWKWLQATCRNLGLKDEAQYYSSLSRPS
jgi:tetratricopeptide (TPR) repeat protein